MYLSSLLVRRGWHEDLHPDHHRSYQNLSLFLFLFSFSSPISRLGARVCGTAIHSTSVNVTLFLFLFPQLLSLLAPALLATLLF